LILNISELGRDHLQRTGKYKVIAGIISPVSDFYNKKVRMSTPVFYLSWSYCNIAASKMKFLLNQTA